jgi:CheY-like chemotaxis protein
MRYPSVDPVESIRGVYALIVDPDARRRELLAAILQYCGAYVRDSDSVDRALRLIGEIRPDVLVAEFASVGAALIGDLRRLKADRGGVVPAIALGAHGLEANALADGFDAFLPTPFVPWDLCRLVGSITTS